MPDIETQIDLLEITMEREGNSKNAGAQEEEADHADKGDSVEFIQFQTWRDQGLEQGALDGIIKHYKVPPFSGQKGDVHPCVLARRQRLLSAGDRRG